MESSVKGITEPNEEDLALLTKKPVPNIFGRKDTLTKIKPLKREENVGR